MKGFKINKSMGYSENLGSLVRKSDKQTDQPIAIFKKQDDEKRIVYGEVYAPNEIDSHGHMMLAADIEVLAHRYMNLQIKNTIDLQHNNVPQFAYPVESFIAREGDPDFTPGAWVLAVKIEDDTLWADVKSGKINGYSMEVLAYVKEIEVDITVQPSLFGKTEDAPDGHSHIFYVELDENGKVLHGSTTVNDGHSHTITRGTATEQDESGHAHRLFI